MINIVLFVLQQLHENQQEASQAVQTLSEGSSSQADVNSFMNQMTPVTMENLTAISGAAMNQNGQLVLTSDSGLGGILFNTVTCVHGGRGGLIRS